MMKFIIYILVSILLHTNVLANDILEFDCHIKENYQYIIKINLYTDKTNSDIINYITLKSTSPFWYLSLNATEKPNIFRDVDSDIYYIFNLEAKTLTQKDIVSKKIIQLWHFIDCNNNQ